MSAYTDTLDSAAHANSGLWAYLLASMPESKCQLCGDGALAHTSFPWQDQHNMPDLGQAPVSYEKEEKMGHFSMNTWVTWKNISKV